MQKGQSIIVVSLVQLGMLRYAEHVARIGKKFTRLWDGVCDVGFVPSRTKGFLNWVCHLGEERILWEPGMINLSQGRGIIDFIFLDTVFVRFGFLLPWRLAARQGRIFR